MSPSDRWKTETFFSVRWLNLQASPRPYLTALALQYSQSPRQEVELGWGPTASATLPYRSKQGRKPGGCSQ